ncbi:MAG: DUF3106 domain-containing protein [Desulfobulbaceae bacterium]|nr:DUF3106 domain-containing protein [Desulfobulbaceae bacterium]
MASPFNKTLFIALLLATFSLSAPAKPLLALEEKAGPNWEQLPPQEQRTLKKFADQWEELSPEKRQKLRRGARLWLDMKEPERIIARNRLEQWEQIGPAQQQDIREGFQKFQQLPLQERNLLQKSRHWFMAQTDTRRQQLKDKWDRLPADDREEFLDRLKERWEEDHQEPANN